MTELTELIKIRKLLKLLVEDVLFRNGQDSKIAEVKA